MIALLSTLIGLIEVRGLALINPHWAARDRAAFSGFRSLLTVEAFAPA